MVNPNPELVNRRGALVWLVRGILGAVAATLGVIVGGAGLSSGLARRREYWVHAASMADLRGATPVEVALRVEREDGYRVTVDRRVVYLVRDGHRVRALSAVCTHLGCRVAWNDAEHRFRCPCHGGRFSPDGHVIGGPPPRPLDELPTRVEGDRIFVQA
jgi:Rieske Fe-S protein